MTGRRPGTGTLRADFLRLWVGQTASEFATQLGFVAIPLIAAATLQATAWQMGLLIASETLPALLVSLPAGVYVDRHDRRAILIFGNAGRALVLSSVAVAWLVGALSLPFLFAVVILSGCLTILFDVAYQSYLPAIVAPEELAPANQRLELSASGAQVAGPGAGGLLVAGLGGAGAILADAAAFAVSALVLWRTRPAVRTTQPPPQRGSFRREMTDGLRAIWGDRSLRNLAASTATFNLASTMVLAVFVLYATRDLGLDAGTFGLLYGFANVGFVGGAFLSGWLARRLGLGTAIFLAACLAAVATALLPLATGPAAVLLLFTGRFIGALATPIYNVALLTFVQNRTPTQLLGRVNATFRFIDWGTVPLGALLGGMLGSTFGLRSALVVGAILGVARLGFLVGGRVREDVAGAAGPDGSNETEGREFSGRVSVDDVQTAR